MLRGGVLHMASSVFGHWSKVGWNDMRKNASNRLQPPNTSKHCLDSKGAIPGALRLPKTNCRAA
eukprot:6611275-Alexandrium_andersonii.AAC.1